MTPEIVAYLEGKAAYRAGLPQAVPSCHLAHRERWLRGWRVAQVVDKAKALAERWGNTLPLDV